MTKPKQIHVPKQQRLQQIVDLLTPEGITNADIVRLLGFTARQRPSVLLRELKAQGRVFGFGVGTYPERFFANAALCDAYRERLLAEIRERRAEACRRAQQRYRESGGKHAVNKRRSAEAAAAKAETAKKRKATRIQSLKVITKAAGYMAKDGSIAMPAPVRIGAAPRVDLPIIIPEGLQIQRAPTPPDRWAVSNPAPVVSSSECRAWAKAVTA